MDSGLIDSLRAAVEASPSFPEPMEELAQLLDEMGRHAEALDWAQRLDAARPSVVAEVMIARQLHALERDDEALAALDRVIEREPNNAAAWTGRGKVLLSKRRVQDAWEASERVLSLLGPTADTRGWVRSSTR